VRWLVLLLLLSATAEAHERRRPTQRFLTWVGWNPEWSTPRANPRVVIEPVFYPVVYWNVVPVQQVPAPAPEPVVVEREVVREVPAPAPQVIIIEQAPAPVPAPAPVAPAPAPAPEPAKPAAPYVPGNDVFTWTDGDGVTHYSTKVPAAAKGRAKKVGGGTAARAKVNE
jgi:Domain of unknown function (DUF4124)